MKRNQVISAFSVLASVGSVLAGAPETTMDWTFSNNSNPSVVQPAAVNPYNATGTALIDVGRGGGYNPGRFLEHLGLSEGYGSATGLWDILDGGITFGIDQYQASDPLTFRVVVTQFASGGSFPFSPNVGFSLPGTSAEHLVSQETVETDSEGFWLKSTYEWQGLDFGTGPLTVTLSSDPVQGNGLLVDALSFTVLGALVPIPEPSISQLGLVGLLVGAFAAMRRRQNVG